MSDVETVVENVMDEVGSRFGKATEFLGDQYEAASEAVRDQYKKARKKVDEADLGAMTDEIRSYVRSNPGKTLLVSLGAGFLIGLMLRRRDE